MEKFRKGIVAVIINNDGKVLMGERSDTPGAWQFPQGGLEPGETAGEAFFREVAEELGNGNCEVLKIAARQTRYRWPKLGIDCVGQEQTWFLGRMITGESPDLRNSDRCFSDLKWEDVSLVIPQTIEWKREAFTDGLTQLGLLTSQ
ncbi:MAG: NUDIX domain-containing protein [Bacteriovorax sp.]